MKKQSSESKEQKERKSDGFLGRIRKIGDQATEALDQATGGRLRPGLDATREKVTDVGSTVSGKKIQQQIEEFTDVVSTAVTGVHRDQRNLRGSFTQLRVQQTGLKLELCEIREEQGKVEEAIAEVQEEGKGVKEALAQVQTKQSDANAKLTRIQQNQESLAEALEQFKESLRDIEQPSRFPWWQFWNWRWI